MKPFANPYCLNTKWRQKKENQKHNTNKRIYSSSVCPHLHPLSNLTWDFYYIPMEYSYVVLQAHHTNLLFWRSQSTFTPYGFISSSHKLVIFSRSQWIFTHAVLQDHRTNLLFSKVTTNLCDFTRSPHQLVIFWITTNHPQHLVEYLPFLR